MSLLDAYPQKGRPHVGYHTISHKLDSHVASIFLCYFCYWGDKGSDPDGWIYKTTAEIKQETALSEREQRTAQRVLSQHGLIEKSYKRLGHQLNYRVPKEALDVFMKSLGSADMAEEATQVIDSTPLVETTNSHWSNRLATPGRNDDHTRNGEQVVGRNDESPLVETTDPPCRNDQSYKETKSTTESTYREYLQTPPYPPTPPAVAECAAEVIEAELISEPETALATIPEKPFLLKTSTKAQSQLIQQQWFEEFWKYYPRKADRSPAEKTFKMHVINQEIFDRTMEALNLIIPEYKRRIEKGDLTKVPYGSTWLNKRPWRDVESTREEVKALTSPIVDRFALARLTRKERASIEFDQRVMREYGSGR